MDGCSMLLALAAHLAVQWLTHLPWWQRVSRRFIWWSHDVPPQGPYGAYTGEPDNSTTAMVLYSDNAEAVEWVNMCWRKMWRVFQRGMERWLADLLQPVFDNLVADRMVPRFVQRLRILEFTIDHEAPYFSNMRRRTSRRDSDLNGVVDVRYTGGARMLLLIEVGQGRWRFKLPVLVSDLDLECRLWLKLRLAPMAPYIGSLSAAFVGPPTIRLQLLPYNRVRIMRIPILQAFLTKLLTVDLPGLIVLPRRLDVNIPPSVGAVAEAAVGRDAVMRAVASAVLQGTGYMHADALENALIAALPLGPQSPAGGVSLPHSFYGELQVTLLEARNLPVWGFPWQSNPYCRLTLGGQAVRSRRDDDTSHAGRHRAPVWNQEFQFLVENPTSQVLTISVHDSRITGRPDLGIVRLPLSRMPSDGRMSAWLPVQSSAAGRRRQGEVHVQLIYKPFEDDEEEELGEPEPYELLVEEQSITDIKSAADASSRAAVAASAAAAAVALGAAAVAAAAAGKNGGGPEGAAARVRAAVLQSLDEAAAGGSLADLTPEDLFPGVAFRISRDEDDEDAPYHRPGGTRKGEGGDRRGADADRADEAVVPVGLATASLDGGEEPSIGRGQVHSERDLPSVVNAEREAGRRALPTIVEAEEPSMEMHGGEGAAKAGDEARLARVGRWGWALVAADAVAGAAASAGASIGEAVGGLASLVRREDGDGEPGDGKPKPGARRRREGGDEDAVEELVMPPDLPIEAIAEEVKESWRLKEQRCLLGLLTAPAGLILLALLSASSAASPDDEYYQSSENSPRAGPRRSGEANALLGIDEENDKGFPGFEAPRTPLEFHAKLSPFAGMRSLSAKAASDVREPLLRTPSNGRAQSRRWSEPGDAGARSAEEAGGTSELQTLFNSVNALCGIGLLATPFALAEMGWLALMLMLALGGLFCHTGLLLERCMDAPWMRSYPDIGERAFGSRGRVAVAVMLYAELYLTSVDLLILAGDNLGAVAPGFQPFGAGFGSQGAWTVVAAAAALPTVWLRSLGLLAWLSALGVVVSFGLTGLVAWEGTLLGFPHRSPPALRPAGALLALGLISFNYGGHALFPSLISAMRRRSAYPRVLGATFASVVAVYVAAAALGYGAFGDSAKQNVTLNMQATLPGALPTKLAVWIVIVAPFTKYALVLTPIATALEELLPRQAAEKGAGCCGLLQSLGVRTALVASTLAVAVSVPLFAFVMAFVGSFLAMTGCVTVPALCYYCIRRAELRGAERVGTLAIVVVGVVLSVAGTVDSVLQITAAYGRS
ncbi:hypothetical protein WJX81_000906 [Elliptochloris bilobata]|uniref:C2 domain-containing protein n=1 Tax=Elliptochloris bilobata TaxID=381761 RepID=A0AAW1QN76_9CHLO